MGLFGNSARSPAARRFASVDDSPYALPFMNGPDLTGQPTSGQSYVDPRGPMPTPQKKFDPFSRENVGAFGDFLLAQAGNPAGLLAMRQREEQRQQQTAFERGERQYQRRRGDEQTDYLARLQAQRENPAPSEFERNLIAAGIDPRSPEGQNLYRQRVENQANPYQAVPGFDEQGQKILRFVRPGGELQQSGPQPGAVVGGFRFRGGNPNDQSSWEPVGGAGSGQRNFP